MSEEICTVEERLEDALSNQIAELDNVEPGSDEYTNISRAITDLYKVRNEQQKIESDYALATESQAIDREKIAADSKAKAKHNLRGRFPRAVYTYDLYSSRVHDRR